MNVNVINSLSGLLILTSLLVIETKKLRLSAIYYGVQSLVLVLIAGRIPKIWVPAGASA